MAGKTKKRPSRKVGNKKLELKPFEDGLALAAMLRIKLWGWHTGAYILAQQGNSSLEQLTVRVIPDNKIPNHAQ